MERTFGGREFKIYRRKKSSSLIRSHHLYNNIWSPYKGKKLALCPGDQEKAFEKVKDATGI